MEINARKYKKKDEIGKEDILELIHATCVLITKLMCNNTTFEDIKKVEAMVRMFLNSYDLIDRLLKEGGSIPAWIQQYNMLCLLNLPDTMRKYGSIRNLWEGGKDGESYLKSVKGHLKAGLVNEWQTWVINNLLKEKIYAEWKSKVPPETNIRNEIRIYGNHNIAATVFNSGKPISVLAYNNKIYICYRDDSGIKGTQIQLSNKIIYDFDVNYYSISLKKKTIMLNEYDIDYVGVLLLPMLTKDGYPIPSNNIKYCYIRSDWT